MLKILFFGDVVGRLGRAALAQVLPDLRREVEPDLVIANGENAAHGDGITAKTYRALREAGVDVVTLGDHAFSKTDAEVLLATELPHLLRPDNFPPGLPGRGAAVVTVGGSSLLVVNLVGRVFMRRQYDCPFRGFDAIWKEFSRQRLAGTVVDFHAEATSEKQAFAWHVDGRASVVLGTHTHVATANPRILPGGTGLVCDVGMVGPRDSVIGVQAAAALRGFLLQRPTLLEPATTGPVTVNAVLVTLDPSSGRAQALRRLDREVAV